MKEGRIFRKKGRIFTKEERLLIFRKEGKLSYLGRKDIKEGRLFDPLKEGRKMMIDEG